MWPSKRRLTNKELQEEIDCLSDFSEDRDDDIIDPDYESEGN